MPVTEVEVEADDAVASNTKAAVSMREADDNTMREMIDGMGADQGFELRVYRTSPKKWGSPPISIEGHCGTFSEWMNEEELKQHFGGGSLQLKVFKPNAKGALAYFRAITIKLPGPPKGEGIDEPKQEVIDFASMGAPEDGGAVSQAMDTMKSLIEDARSNNSGGMDMAAMTGLFTTLMAPMQAQMAASQTQLVEAQRLASEKETRILELISTKPDTSEKDGLLNKMFDTESSRSEHLRNMHESEMRQLRENSKEEAKRADDRHRDEQRRTEDIQQREIANMTRSSDTMMDTLKMSYDSRIEGYKKDIERLERDMGRVDTELITLRAKKDKTVIEQVSEIQTIKEAFTSISGDSPDDRKWYEKVLEGAVENPEGLAQIVGMVTGQGNPAQQQQQLQQPQQQQLQQPPQQQQQQEESIPVEDMPINQPFRGEDGIVYIKVPPDGSVVTYEQGLQMAKDLAKKNGLVVKPEQKDVKLAIGFMENAFRAGTDAATFAASAKSMIPQDILKYMESVGIDKFLNEVAILEQGSPLRNQAGRTFMREVAKFLLEGVTE